MLKPPAAWYCPALHNCLASHCVLPGSGTPGFNSSFCPEKCGRSRQILTLDEPAGKGIFTDPSMAGQGPLERSSLGGHQGRGSCLLQCMAPWSCFCPLSGIKGMKALAGGTRPMVWAKLKSSEEASCSKQEKRETNDQKGARCLMAVVCYTTTSRC